MAAARRSGRLGGPRWLPLLLVAPLVLAPACFLLPKAEYPTCSRPPTAEDTEAAQGAHKAGKRLYDKESYERAIEAWLAAYELDCSAHRLLINIARAHEKMGDDDEKLRALETYVARAGKDADMKIVEEVEALKADQEGGGDEPTDPSTADPVVVDAGAVPAGNGPASDGSTGDGPAVDAGAPQATDAGT